MQTKFQIGDVVTIKNGTDLGADSAGHFYEGITGVVCRVWTTDYDEIRGTRLGVEWDFKGRSGHDCAGTCKYGYGWNVYSNYLKLVSHAQIIDESDLMEVLAL